MVEDKNNEEGIDLSGALKDPGTGVKFQGEQQRSSQTFYSGTPKIIQWVIKYSSGYIKNEKQASYVLIGFVVVAIIFSLFFIFSGGNNNKSHWYNPDPAKRFDINTQSN